MPAMKVWVPDYYARELLGPLPPAVELEIFPDDPRSSASLAEV